MALISTTTISGDDSYPEPKDYEITLKIKVTKYDGNGLHPALGAMMNRVLEDWNEGRYPFFVEQMHQGLEDVFKNAVYAAIQRDCQEVYGKEMVEVSPNHKQSRWSIEASKLMSEFDMPFMHPTWKAKVERVLNKDEENFVKYMYETDEDLAS